MVVLKSQILGNFYFGRVYCVERTEFWMIFTLEGCNGPVRTDISQFPLWEVVVVL